MSPKASPNVRLGTAPLGAALGNSVNARQRGNQLPSGFAVPRPPAGDVDFIISFPVYGYWGSWYPWFGGGFGWGLGYVGYNPWIYGATWWGWGRYGFWYDPYGYYWDPGPAAVEVEPKAPPTTGMLRIRANEASAQVYVDGTLVGVVDDFDGLSDHLELDRGRHTIELRLDGFTTVTKDVVIAAGKTQTVRLSLKK